MSISRIVALIDMDCFYVAVEERDDPSIKGKPAAVVQYKSWKGGGIIAVNYEARAKGVGRHIRGDDAKAICPEIILVRVPETRGKADLTKYREAGRDVINVLTDFCSTVERASVDEAYIDLTEAVDARFSSDSPDGDLFAACDPLNIIQTLNMDYFDTNFVMEHESTETWLNALKASEIVPFDQLRLAVGAEIVGKIRKAVFDRTGFRCSAGIAHNKVLAKLACGLNKPNKQTILPHECVPELWKKTKVKKVRNLGGKLGDFLTEILHCENMIDLVKYTEKELSNHLGSKTASWLFHLARGYDDELVNPRQLAKSIGCNKNFPGPDALFTKEKSKFWINQLSAEVVERIQKDLEVNNRKAKVLTLHVKFENQNALSRSCGLPQYNAERMALDAYLVLEKLYQTLGVLPINSLGLIASKFEDELDTTTYGKINKYFSCVPLPQSSKSASDKPIAVIKGDSPSKKQILSETSSASVPVATTLNNSTITTKNVEKPEEPDAASTSHTSKTFNEENKKPPAETEISPRKLFFTFNAASTSQKQVNTSQLKSPLKKDIPCTRHDDSSKPNQPNSSEPEVNEVCTRCGKSIPIWEIVSHMDYHFAKDLQREINGLAPLASDVRPSSGDNSSKAVKNVSPKKRTRGGGTSTSISGAKRGRGSKSVSSGRANSIKTKTLDAYFTPKS